MPHMTMMLLVVQQDYIVTHFRFLKGAETTMRVAQAIVILPILTGTGQQMMQAHMCIQSLLVYLVRVHPTIICNPMTLSTVGDAPHNGLRVKTDHINTVQVAQLTVPTRIPSCFLGNRKQVRVKPLSIFRIKAMALAVQAEAQTAFLLKVITIISLPFLLLAKGNRITTCSLTKLFTVGKGLHSG